MDVKAAAASMLPLILEAPIPEHHPEYGQKHLVEMVQKIHRGEVSGDKAHRWLGWIQDCVCAVGDVRLATIKKINHEA